MKKLWLTGFVLCVLVAGMTAYIAATMVLRQQESPVKLLHVAKPPFTAAEIAAIAPHKALYRIEMVQKSSSSQVMNISGQMYFEWKPACDDAWSTNHRFDLTYDYADSPQMRNCQQFYDL